MVAKKRSETAKATRARSWRRGQERKEERRRKQAAAERRNRQLIASGQLTLWQQACARAKERKATAAHGSQS